MKRSRLRRLRIRKGSLPAPEHISISVSTDPVNLSHARHCSMVDHTVSPQRKPQQPKQPLSFEPQASQVDSSILALGGLFAPAYVCGYTRQQAEMSKKDSASPQRVQQLRLSWLPGILRSVARGPQLHHTRITRNVNNCSNCKTKSTSAGTSLFGFLCIHQLADLPRNLSPHPS